MKQCSCCKQNKVETEYYKNKNSKDGLTARCKDCIKIYQQREEVKLRSALQNKAYYERIKNTEEYKKKAEAYRETKLKLQAKWREENKEHIQKYAEENRERNNESNRLRREQVKKYNQENKEKIEEKYPEKICSMCKQKLPRKSYSQDLTSKDGLSYYCKDCQHKYSESRREYIRQYGRTKYNSEKAMQYYYNNKEEIARKNKERIEIRRKVDNNFVINHTMQNLLNSILKSKRQNSPSLFERCGYTAEQLIKHIESQFTPEMNWDNYGSYWELDHIIPKYSFSYKSYDDETFKECWALNNLRPLSVKENQSRNKVDY